MYTFSRHIACDGRVIRLTGNLVYLINKDDGLVYRKEQFTSDNDMFAEYLVADRRYKKDEIITLVEAEGLKVEESRYVQAGHWDTALSSTDAKAKEILLIIRNV